MVRPDTRPRAAEVTERGSRAVHLRAQRWTFQEIADELGFESKGSAHRAYVRALAEMRRESPESELLRMAESEYLDHLRSKIAPAVEVGDPGAIGQAVRISERYSKLNGLDLNESRVAGALEAGAVAQLAAASNLQAIIIRAMGEIGMQLEQQDQLIAAINAGLAEQESGQDMPAESVTIIEGETA